MMDLFGEAMVDLMVFGGLLATLGIGGVIADRLFPRIPLIRRFLDSLPEYDDDEELCREKHGSR